MESGYVTRMSEYRYDNPDRIPYSVPPMCLHGYAYTDVPTPMCLHGCAYTDVPTRMCLHRC